MGMSILRKRPSERRKYIYFRHDNFVPNPTQLDFCLDESLVRLFVGGVGVGKSAVLAFEGNRLNVANSGHDGFIVAPTYNMLVRVTLPAFLKMMPDQLIKVHHKSHKFIECVTGSKIWYGSANDEESAGNLDGSNLAWAAMDEVRYLPRAAYRNLLARIRVRCPRNALIGATTPQPNGWLEDTMFANGVKTFFATTHENRHNLADGYIESMMSQYSEEDIRSLIYGELIKHSGVVYKDWDGEKNVRNYEWNPNHELYCSVDFGYNEPHCLWIAHVPSADMDGEFDDIVIDEIKPERITADEFAIRILERNQEKGYYVHDYFGDPAGGQKRTGKEGGSDIADFANRGIDIVAATNPKYRDIKTGLTIVRSRIRSSEGTRRLFVSRNMAEAFMDNRGMKRGFCKDITSYRYPDKDKPGILKDLPCKTKNIHSEHSMDCIRMYCVHMYPHLGMVSGDFTTASLEPTKQDDQFEIRDSAWQRLRHDEMFDIGQEF